DAERPPAKRTASRRLVPVPSPRTQPDGANRGPAEPGSEDQCQEQDDQDDREDRSYSDVHVLPPIRAGSVSVRTRQGYPGGVAPKPADDLAVGGQAVPGGVAILGGDRHVTAVRASTGLIETRVTRVASPPPALTRIPVLRGVVALGRSLRL